VGIENPLRGEEREREMATGEKRRPINVVKDKKEEMTMVKGYLYPQRSGMSGLSPELPGNPESPGNNPEFPFPLSPASRFVRNLIWDRFE
jgi:hypothetical protein